MHVQDLKRWHWVAISVLVGLALSFVWSSVDWDENLQTMGQREFESGLVTPFPQAGHLAKVTVMPLMEGKNKVVAEIVRNTKTPGVVELRPVAYIATVPYKAGQWRGQEEQHTDVLAYLKTVKDANPDTAFKYAWYRETWAIYLLWTGAAILLIGGVWPSVVSLMVGAGLGFHKEDKGPDYDLSRFKGEEEKKTEKKEPTAAEIEHLHQLEEELERKLAAQRAGLPIPEDPPAPTATGQVRKLDGGPLEAATANQNPEEHDYKGEFYPVDRAAKKKP